MGKASQRRRQAKINHFKVYLIMRCKFGQVCGRTWPRGPEARRAKAASLPVCCSCTSKDCSRACLGIPGGSAPAYSHSEGAKSEKKTLLPHQVCAFVSLIFRHEMLTLMVCPNRGVGPRVQLDSPLFAPPPVRPQGPLANFAPRQTPAPLNPSSSAPLEHAPPRAGEQQHPAAPTPGFPGGAGNTMGLRRRGGGHAGGEPTSAPAMVWQTQQMEVQHNASSRLVEARKVESMIGELGQMFSKFSTLVAEQQEVVMHIEDDVEAAHGHASEGQAHLARYYQIVQGNRGLIIKIFAILMCFIVLLTLIF